MALREGNSKDWSVMCCKEHSYLYLGHSGLMTTQSHLQWNLLSPFQVSAMSDGMCEFSVITPTFIRESICLLLPLNSWISDQIQMQISELIIVTKLQKASFLTQMQTSQFKSWSTALPP